MISVFSYLPFQYAFLHTIRIAATFRRVVFSSLNLFHEMLSYNTEIYR
jgi:hypothetical protein